MNYRRAYWFGVGVMGVGLAVIVVVLSHLMGAA